MDERFVWNSIENIVEQIKIISSHRQPKTSVYNVLGYDHGLFIAFYDEYMVLGVDLVQLQTIEYGPDPEDVFSTLDGMRNAITILKSAIPDNARMTDANYEQDEVNVSVELKNNSKYENLRIILYLDGQTITARQYRGLSIHNNLEMIYQSDLEDPMSLNNLKQLLQSYFNNIDSILNDNIKYGGINIGSYDSIQEDPEVMF